MRIKSQKEDILTGIQSVAGIVSSKNTLPILSNVLIEADKKGVKLTTTDLDIGMINNIEATVDEDGAITVPAKRFVEIIRELPSKEIQLYTKKNNTLIIECDGVTCKILGVPKEEFPKLPTFNEKEQIHLEQCVLRNMLTMTSFAMSHDETRYVLNGICFLINEASICLVATDGRRLAISTQQQQTGLKEQRKLILPTKTIQELLKALDDEGEVKLLLSKNQALFKIGELVIISRLIEGEFPNYEQAIPKETKQKIKVVKECLQAAIKRASILTTPESQAIKLQVQKDRLTISKITPEVGEVKEDIDAEYKGEEFFIGFNPGYLLDALKNIETENIEIELTGPEKPGVIRVGEGYIYIVLPMQIV